MSEFDFKLAELPEAAPLQHSAAVTQIERELKELFVDLFSLVGKDTFDAGVLGAAHLGSFDLVRKMVNHDGLVLLKGTREESATRYLYRAWKSGDVQKRGLHFVRTYLQLLFPGEASVRQMWHDKRYPYGSAFISNELRDPYWFHFLGEAGLKLDGSWKAGRPLLADQPEPPLYTPDEESLFLTSRIEILLGLEALASGENQLEDRRSVTSGLLDVVRAVIPARLVPVFRFWLRFVLSIQVRTSGSLLMQKNSMMRYRWCGRIITEAKDAKWSLGRDAEPVSLPLPFGSFRVGERRGGKSVWRLHSCRAEGSLLLEQKSGAILYRIPAVGERGRRLDGVWRLSGRQAEVLTWASVSKSVEIVQPQQLLTAFHEHIDIRYPANPTRLGAAMKVGGWRLNGEVRLTRARVGQKLGGFKLVRQGIGAEVSSTYQISATANACPASLPLQTVAKLRHWTRKLGGRWTLGAMPRIGRFWLNGVRLRSRKMTETHVLGGFRLGQNEHVGLADLGTARSMPLNGSWRLGAMAVPEFSLTITRVR
ncbi:hypothetical protein D9M71_95770 [compost metagenome]